MVDTVKQLYSKCASSYAIYRGLGSGFNFANVNKSTKDKAQTERRRELIKNALEDYITSTANGEEEVRSGAISALMLMFWAEVGKMAEKCKAVAEYDYEDFSTQLYKCINEAAEYYEKDKLAGKNVNAEAYINSLISSRGAAAILYESNLDKHKINANMCSLDAVINDDDGREITVADTIYDEDEESDLASDRNVKWLIQSFIDKKKIVESIILDTIAYNDVQKITKKKNTGIDTGGNEYSYTSGTSEFWSYKLVQILSKLPENYFDYFFNKYDVKDIELQTALDRIKNCNNQKLYKMVENTLETCKKTVKL